jgi:hypothetical protein
MEIVKDISIKAKKALPTDQIAEITIKSIAARLSRPLIAGTVSPLKGAAIQNQLRFGASAAKLSSIHTM